MKTSRMSLDRLREEFHKRSWESMLPDPRDTLEVRAEKRDRLTKLLEIKEVELTSLKLSDVDGGDRRGPGADGELAEIAETPVQPQRFGSRLGDESKSCMNTCKKRRNPNRSSVGAREQESGGRLEQERRSGDRGQQRSGLPAVRGGAAGLCFQAGSTAIPETRTHPRAQALMNDDNTPMTRQRTGRESLSRALLLRRGGLDTPMTAGAVNTPGETLGTIYTSGTPGVYIPSMRERMIDVTGTELAEDMAGNLVAGIFAASDPCSQEDSRGIAGNHSSEKGRETRTGATMHESQIENHTQERSKDRSMEQLFRIPFGAARGEGIGSFLMRFPEYCMYGRATRSGKHAAILLGSLIDKEPREIVVLSLEDDIRVSQVVGVQRSRRYFPSSIPFNVNFFDLAETSKGDPVLLVSCAFDLTDLNTQEVGEEGDTKLHVLVRGKEAVGVESEEPIIFVQAFGDRNEVVVTGAYADHGARIMKFDPLWQSFTWKKDFEFILPEDHKEGVVTHISKLLVLEDAANAMVHEEDRLFVRNNGIPSPPSIKAVLASDITSEDIVYTFGANVSRYDLIENAEVFVDGDSWQWFLVHTKAVAELGFAGGPLAPGDDIEKEEKTRGKDPRTFTAIFASQSYVAAGDIHGVVTVWDVRGWARGRVACKRFSMDMFEPTKVTSIAQVRAKDQDALVVMGSSGVCLLISLSELFEPS